MLGPQAGPQGVWSPGQDPEGPRISPARSTGLFSPTTMKAPGHWESWSPGPQVHPPFQEAPSHPNVSTRVRLTDLPTSSRCHRANLEADVRRGWGFKGAPRPHWLPGQQTRKAVPCSLLPLVLWSVSGTFSCFCSPPLVVSPNKPHSQSRVGVPCFLSLEMCSVSGRFQAGWGPGRKCGPGAGKWEQVRVRVR